MTLIHIFLLGNLFFVQNSHLVESLEREKHNKNSKIKIDSSFVTKKETATIIASTSKSKYAFQNKILGRDQGLVDSIYIIQPPNQHLKVEEFKDGLDMNLILSVCAIIISVFSVWLPIRSSKRANRRDVLFKMYEVWNSDRLNKARTGFWRKHTKIKSSSGGQINLKELYETDRAFYYDYERIFDVLSDIATFYEDNSIDRKLVEVVFKTFFKSYGNALKNDYVFDSLPEPERVKMTEGFYQNVIDLKERIENGRPTFSQDLQERILKLRFQLKEHYRYFVD